MAAHLNKALYATGVPFSRRQLQNVGWGWGDPPAT